ncbi:MAG: DNA methyltransferase [Betaproteobacteria bacterium]
MNAPDKPTTQATAAAMPRAIEVGFPIVEINRLAEPERNSFKPIYQMHKWFARRASCVFRAILLGALKPATQPDGSPTDLMAEFYKNHAEDPDTKGKVVLDPFMGGGTTVVESLRLGCNPIGIDLNPVAWFVVKTEIEPVEIEALQAAFERLAARPVYWNEGKPLRETLLNLYKTEVAPGVEADVIYTFWVKHAICTDPTCKKEVPLFKDYVVAQKTSSVRYWRDLACPACGHAFDWETQVASLIAEKKLMVNAPRGAAGEGRPTAAWTYVQEPVKPKRRRELTYAELDCPCCTKRIKLAVPWEEKKEKKKVPLTVLLCPSCETVWQWRGPEPEGEVACPACAHHYNPRVGNVPEKGKFQCVCGNRDDIIQSLRLLPQDKRLPVRPYAMQAFLPTEADEIGSELESDGVQTSLFGDGADRQNLLSLARQQSTLSSLPNDYLLPANGKLFKRFSVSDRALLQEAERFWDTNKSNLPHPKSEVPLGEKTKSGLLSHHFNYWHELFAPRQLLALSTLLQGVIAEPNDQLREMLLCAFSNALEGNNLFVRNIPSRKTPGGTAPAGIFARHDYQPKATICEQNVWGTESGNNTFISRMEMLEKGLRFAKEWPDAADGTALDPLPNERDATLKPGSSSDAAVNNTVATVAITDPPYAGNVNYSELADFFYVWLRLALKERYSWFIPEYCEKYAEVIENRTRGKSIEDFYAGLSDVFRQTHANLPDQGLLVFTFHHADQAGTVWEGLLQALCDTGFEIIAVYPVHAERESSLHLLDKDNISYDLIHVCRKRQADPAPRSWAGVRQEVRRRARTELAAIESGRYGGKPLAEPDVRLICIGKCLELYSAHYDKVLDHEGKTLPLHRALQDISAIVDQLVTRDRPLPAELENIDSLSYVWRRYLMPRRAELSVDNLSKDLRALQVSVDDVKDAGLAVRGRDGKASGRSRSYKIKQPAERLEQALANLERVASRQMQTKLFDTNGQPEGLVFADLWHALIALADAGESVLPLLEKFRGQWPEISAGLKYCKEARSDWEPAIARVIGVMEGAPLLVKHGAA